MVLNPLLNGGVSTEWKSVYRVHLSFHDEDVTVANAHTTEFRMD